MSNCRASDRYAPRWATTYTLGTLFVVTIWGLTVCHQINLTTRTLNQAINARQVVIVPHPATLESPSDPND